MLADGEALGAGAEITPAMQGFLRYFVEQLDKAGVEFTILAPSRVSVVRARDAGDGGPDGSGPAGGAGRSVVHDIPVQ